MALLEVSAAVLIGGRSRRMGEAKAMLRLATEAPAMIELVVARLAKVASGVYLVGSPPWTVPERIDGLRRVTDRGVSAADGVVAALRESATSICVVVGCDMPFLDAGLLREMAELAARKNRGVVAVDRSGAHPLHAVYHRDALGTIERLVESGERSLAVLVREAGMIPICIDGAGRPERERWSTFNVNTPSDLELAQRRWSTISGDGEVY
jgi:molybdopterin-guanine dinucleotide biosynthesis protein A